MKGVAEFGEVGLLARRFHIDHTAEHRVVGNHPDHHAVHARQRSDHRTAEARLNFEGRFAINDQVDQFPHIVGLALRTRNDGRQRIFATVNRITADSLRRQLPDIRRHIGQKAPNLLQAIRFRFSRVIDGAGGIDRHFVAAQLFFSDLGVVGALDHGRTGGEDLAGVFHHHCPVREYGASRGPASSSAHHGADHRHYAHQLNRTLETIGARAGKGGMAAA